MAVSIHISQLERLVEGISKRMNQKVYIYKYHKIGITKPIFWYKMLTKKQLQLFMPFGTNIFKEYSYKEIVKLANEKSNNALQIALQQFLKEKIVIERKIGNSKLYKVNDENDICYDYLALLKYEGFSSSLRQSIEALKVEIEKYVLFYSLVVFGSYATGQQKKESDLDIAILLPDSAQEKNMKIAVNMSSSSTLIPIHAQIITYNDFFEMLINKQANVGKEIALKHRAVHNVNIFYKIVKRAIDHGFHY